MAIMRSTDHPNLLSIPLNEVFHLFLKEVPPQYTRYINVEDTDMNFEESLKVSEFGPLALKPEGALVQFENIPSSALKRITPDEYALGYVITRKLRDDDQHGVFINMTRALRRTVRNKYETLSISPFNNATDTAAANLGIDGKAMLNTAHPLMGGGTQANRAATDLDLSSVAVESAVLNFSTRVGESNQPRLVSPSIALVSTSDQYEAARIFRNAKQAGTADNDENWVRQGPDDNAVSKYIVSRYLTDLDAWFILSDKSEHDVTLRVRVSPEFQVGSDFRTDNYLARAYTRLGVGFFNYHNIYGSMGAA